MKKVLVLLTAFLALLPGRAQEIAELKQAFRNLGFEDIRISLQADTLFVSIEDHAFRGTFRGAAMGIKEIAEHYPEILNVEMLLTDYKQPQLIVHASRHYSLWDVRVDREMKQARFRLKDVEPIAPTTGKIDVTIYPMVSLTNNKLDHLFDYSVRLAPAVGITLWQGARVTIQPIFPILHRLDKSDSQRRIQIGTANIQQQLFTSKRWKATAALGFFHPERVGLQTKIELHACRNLDFAIDAGLTGQATNRKKGFLFSPWKRFNFMAVADYYEPQTKLQLELAGGRFLFGDYGTRLDVSRHFGEYTIGLYGILTGGEHNAGFHFAIPMSGKKQRRSKVVRLRLPEYYAMEYSMTSYFKYWEQRMGEGYKTQPDQNRSAHYWEPAFIQEYITRILNGSFE